MSRYCILGGVAAALLLAVFPSYAAKKKAPVAGTTLFPLGAQRGMTSVVTLSTKLDAYDRQLAIDCPGVQLVPGEKDLVQVMVPPFAPLGPHLIHVFNPDGASEPRWFSIGTLPEVREVEPNDVLGTEQSIDHLPVCINGQLEKRGDVDLFAFLLKQGDSLTALLESYSLGSPVDAMLQVRDDQNSVLATAHDGRNLDPVLVFNAPKAGRYSVEVAGFTHPPAADVSFTGGAAIAYRLHLTTGPTTLRVFPAAVSRTEMNHLDLLGSSQSNSPFDGSHLQVEPVIQSITPPNALLPIQVVVTDLPVLREPKADTEPPSAMQVTVPCCVAGRIAKPGETDHFKFQGKKGDRLSIRLYAKALGLPLDAVIAVSDMEGKELARNDDASEGDDPLLNWKVPADGTFQVGVSDLFNRGGEAAEYVLMLAPEEPSFTATLTNKPPLSIEAGKSLEVTATVKRLNGFAGELVASIHGLPAGVFAETVSVPEKKADVTVKLQAAANAVLSNGPIQLVLSTKGKDNAPMISHTALLDLRGDVRRGTSLLDNTDAIWLTVLPAAPSPPKALSQAASPAPASSQPTPVKPIDVAPKPASAKPSPEQAKATK